MAQIAGVEVTVDHFDVATTKVFIEFHWPATNTVPVSPDAASLRSSGGSGPRRRLLVYRQFQGGRDVVGSCEGDHAELGRSVANY
ncbi:hypothetical protein I553_2164 [Mycobacterium xenopi 4042]|uniref:Uncharacterized protein n=1 Tax=Mycobacterium xenopi 4042 TaxID=1299334 RepID=X8DLP4_MYCXE|nr:hypothetical protein I553_2164 [Mycobacterium xenopi 4042]